PQSFADAFEDEKACGDTSETDLLALGDADFETAAREALAILKKHSAFFEWAKGYLVTHLEITDGTAADAFRAIEEGIPPVPEELPWKWPGFKFPGAP
ncbi:MAG TPA: hypothetical protein VHM91_09155, partial [Verrucomicrobiales bacterium]|nr:hypothetical protein [Verrucomicrobiales bacterium]